MLKKSLGIVFAVIFVFQFATALETNIKINTLGNHLININFLNPERSTETIISFESQTLQSGNGEVVTTFVSEEETFDLTVFVMEEHEKIVYEEFDDLVNGEDFSLILLPGIPKESMIEFDKDAVEPEVEAIVENASEVKETSEENISLENTSIEQITGNIVEQSNETSENKSLFSKAIGIVGFAFTDDENSNPYSKFIFYFVIAFALLGTVFFMKGSLKKKFFTKKDNNNSPPIVVKKDDNQRQEIPKQEDKKDEEGNKDSQDKEEQPKQEDKGDDEEGDSYVRDAESKMKEAETEMRIASDARRLKEDRKKLMRDRDYLKRLKESRDKEQ